jgi:hypothetical protein
MVEKLEAFASAALPPPATQPELSIATHLLQHWHPKLDINLLHNPSSVKQSAGASQLSSSTASQISIYSKICPQLSSS